MVKKSLKNRTITNTALPLTRLTRTVYFLCGLFALSIVIFDSGNLITREAVIQRWTLLSFLLIINSVVWLVSSQLQKKPSITIALTTVMVVSLTTFAGFVTYWERGMASTSTIFYVLPLLVIATLKNRHALLATATLSAVTYAFAAVKYFNDFFNEGYRVQLWGSLVMYGGTIFICAWLIMIITDLRHDSH